LRSAAARSGEQFANNFWWQAPAGMIKFHCALNEPGSKYRLRDSSAGASGHFARRTFNPACGSAYLSWTSTRIFIFKTGDLVETEGDGRLRLIRPILPDDFGALSFQPQKSEQVMETYLAELAQKHGLKLATFDRHNKHEAVEVLA
jgi:hypothetical protein